MRPLLAASLFALALAGAGCAEREAAPPAKASAAKGERLTLKEQAVADLKPVAATVTTRDMADARARIGGTLVELAVREGDVVRKGQLIGRVADERLSLETAAYGAQAAAAAAEAARTEADLARVQTLYEKGFYAKARLDQAQAAAKAARGQAQAAQAQRAASAELGSQGAILAPASGRVLTADTPAGSVVSPGQSVATITAGEPVLRLEIPEAQGRTLRAGQRVAIETGDLAGLASEGVITQVYPAVSAGRVVADISVPGLTADRVGQRVRVKAPLGERQALVLPKRYVATRFGLDFVRVVGPDNRVSEVAVQTAPAPVEGMVEILSGAQPGDVVLSPGAAG